MKYLKNIILLFVFLNSFYGFTQCETVKSLFENDLYASKELRDYASKADDPDKVFDAWHLLLEEKSLEKTNAKVLKEVEDNYQAIKNAGGYSKWKNVTGAGRTLSEMRNSVDEWVRLQRHLTTSNNQLREFNTATILYNKATGKYYYGANRGIFVSGAEIHSTLAGKLPETSTNNAYKLGNCAECDAVNQALHDGANWGDLQMHTIGVQWNTGATFPKPLCSNCEVTFVGIEIIQ
ncbi:hypothetical protein [Flavobacterium davisii]|uniref:Uncharacterized protein n=1 Tax=Flavobacterium columnare TaxID=996 RepID=A0A8G0KST0_9FLAO|nr:hypothetical protein [Flavobacterium davisii]QYS89468.1 hypothetical protein JJC05_04095 [Flavobacterium davisii]